MSVLPTGTVTFLFTDIEGSTALWERHPEAMQVALERHHSILREAIASEHGVIFNEAGDGLCAAFASAGDAFKAAHMAQRALHQSEWGETAIRVRLGLHTGAAEAVESGYRSGPTLNRAARIMSVAHGGQILLSQTTADLLRGQLPEGVSLRDLGQHRLKGLAENERLWQVVASDLPTEFPALKSASTTPNNLPVQLTSFIGREKELAELRVLLAGTRLLTLTGSGGTGKTRLSLQLAVDMFNDFRDGVWLTELAPLSDPDLIPQTVMSTLGLREQPGQPLLTTLTNYLGDKQLLLILDNCEHVLEASARLANTLVHAAPGLKILASSREGLGIAGETSYRVPSLEAPDPKLVLSFAEGAQIPTSTLRGYAAVELFVERAGAVKASFTLNETNAQAIAQICSRLDGIPLAIELAAARAKSLPVETIAERLNDRFRLLTGGSRTALPRQQTLRGMIDWSYSLLSEPERMLLRRLSVFAGGWTLEAVEAVCVGDGIEAADVLDLLSHLVEKSLVVLDEQASEPRYRMLETVRQYAREKLLDSGEGEAMRDRHLLHFTAFAEEAEVKIQGRDQVRWMDRLDTELDNLRAAIDWSLQRVDCTPGLRLASALWWFWFTHSHHAEAYVRIKEMLAKAGPDVSPSLQARAKLALFHQLYAIKIVTDPEEAALAEDALVLAQC